MRKFLVSLAVVALVGSLAVAAEKGKKVPLAETDNKALSKIKDIQKGTDNANQIQTLRVKGSATVGGAVTAAGTVTGKELAITEGTFDVVNTTQLVFIASGVTNVIDADITN